MIDQTHWVYVIAFKKDGVFSGPVKVGYTKNLESRLKSIQTGCPGAIDFAYVFEMPNKEAARYLEGSFHGTQSERRAHGEWYDCEPVIAIHILCIATRAFVQMTNTDPDLVESILDLTGVLWAEKRFKLAVPDNRRLQ
ncbi:GIY-YIG nuclease family protein [Afipia carboxidovorans]|uniref:GIY-YIG nuclease family protein n=1 Tax=Afipia carboxidovorans TaxID=40137 RepID=UPI003093078C|nr:hypothetical protein CRBSH125_09710 [Afipia carboxidovorans]